LRADPNNDAFHEDRCPIKLLNWHLVLGEDHNGDVVKGAKSAHATPHSPPSDLDSFDAASSYPYDLAYPTVNSADNDVIVEDLKLYRT
jgi:hypothetical protein